MGMPVEKVSLSLNSDLVDKARRVAGPRGLSALRIRLRHERLRTLLAEMDAEYGSIPAEELKRARKIWPDRPLRENRSRRTGYPAVRVISL